MGDKSKGNSAEDIVSNLLIQFPDAQVVRSHSAVQSSKLSQLFWRLGLNFESNDYLPAEFFEFIKPLPSHAEITRVPYFFSDELACLSGKTNIRELCNRRGLKVFDFHPVHVFLNTESLDRYERTRPLHNNPKELIKYRFDGYGTRNRLIELLEWVMTP
jgi:hypothetical protein